MVYLIKKYSSVYDDDLVKIQVFICKIIVYMCISYDLFHLIVPMPIRQRHQWIEDCGYYVIYLSILNCVWLSYLTLIHCKKFKEDSMSMSILDPSAPPPSMYGGISNP